MKYWTTVKVIGWFYGGQFWTLVWENKIWDTFYRIDFFDKNIWKEWIEEWYIEEIIYDETYVEEKRWFFSKIINFLTK